MMVVMVLVAMLMVFMMAVLAVFFVMMMFVCHSFALFLDTKLRLFCCNRVAN